MHPQRLTIRPARPSDLSFIYATWLRGLYYGNSWFRQIDKSTFMRAYQPVIERYLERSDVRVACLPEDDDVVIGYAVGDASVLHWVHVKKNWRQMGVARSLVNRADLSTVTHLTTIGKKLKPEHVRFNPFYL